MATGRVVRFDEVKGYGFIAPRDGGEDVFVHANEITDRGLMVGPGTLVEFLTSEGERGLRAYDVRIIDQAQPAQSAQTQVGTDQAAANGSHLASQVPDARAPVDDELCEVFTEREFVRQITDLLLKTAPQLTGQAILELRSSLVHFARENRWLE